MNSHQWAEFVIGDLFTLQRPKSRKEDDYSNGDAPFVASGCVNNGVTKFCRPNDGEVLDLGNCLTISPVDGSCYYQPADCLGRGGAGSSIIILYARTFVLNRFNGLFISKAISQTTSSKYSYGHMASLDRIKRDVILLPITADRQPDWQFMEGYMRQKEQQILKITINKLCKQLIYNQLGRGGNVTSSITSGKHLILLKSLPTLSVANVLKKQTIRKAIPLMYLPHRYQTVSMALLETRAA